MRLGRRLPFPVITPGRTIPRRIVQTRPAGPLSPALAGAVEQLRALNPDWHYACFDDAALEAYVRAHFPPAVARALQRIDPRYGAARADLFRYLTLYREGGLYLDIKSTTDRPLSETIAPEDGFILSQWRNRPGDPFEGYGLPEELAHIPGGEYQQWFIASAPGHPFLRAVIQRVLHNIAHYRTWRFGIGKPGVLRVTGPIAYTLAIAPLLPFHPHRRIANETEIGLRYSVFPPEAHIGSFASHYSQHSRPIVRQPGVGGLASRLYWPLKWRSEAFRDSLLKLAPA